MKITLNISTAELVHISEPLADLLTQLAPPSAELPDWREDWNAWEDEEEVVDYAADRLERDRQQAPAPVIYRVDADTAQRARELALRALNGEIPSGSEASDILNLLTQVPEDGFSIVRGND